MNTNRVIELLTNKHGYTVAEFEKLDLIKRLRDRNLEVWKNENRYIITKGYVSEAQFDTWLYDQVIISFLYDELPARYKNNLYFLLILNWEGKLSDPVIQRITEIEKNHRVCRKYVIATLNDMERIPSLNNKFGDNIEEIFNFDTEFRARLFPPSESTPENSNVTERVRQIVNLYFEQYDEQSEEKLLQQKQRIQYLLKGSTAK